MLLADAPSSNTRRRNAALRSIWRTPGRRIAQCVDHREFVEQLRVADAGHLVGCLGELGRADHVGRVDPVEPGSARSIAMSLVVDRRCGRRAEVVGQRLRELFDAVVEIREQRPVQVIAGKVVGHPVDVGRVEVRRRSPLTTTATGPEQRRMVAVLGGLGGTRGVRHRAGAEQHQAVDALCVELILQSLESAPCASGRGRAVPGSPAADRRSCRPIVDGSTSLALKLLKDAKIA